MNQEDEIKRILASLDAQLHIDALIISENQRAENKEQTFKTIKENLILERIQNYPKNEEKIQEEIKMYNQTFKETIEEEKAKNKREQKKVQKAIQAYGKSFKVQNGDKERKVLIQEHINSQEKRKSIFIKIKELLTGTVTTTDKDKEIKVKTHQDFMKSMEPRYLNKNNTQSKNVINRHKSELEK